MFLARLICLNIKYLVFPIGMVTRHVARVTGVTVFYTSHHCRDDIEARKLNFGVDRSLSAPEMQEAGPRNDNKAGRKKYELPGASLSCCWCFSIHCLWSRLLKINHDNFFSIFSYLLSSEIAPTNFTFSSGCLVLLDRNCEFACESLFLLEDGCRLFQ